MENAHVENNFIFHRNFRSCNRYFDWRIGFLNCTGTSIQWVSIIIIKMGTGQLAPFRWTNENLFDMHSAFKMSVGKKQKATKLPYHRIFAAQLAEKKCKDFPASETDARLPVVTVQLC